MVIDNSKQNTPNEISEVAKRSPVTFRAVIVGMVSLAGYIIIDVRASMMKIGMSPDAEMFPSPAGLLFVLVMLFINTVLWKSKFKFTQGEIITVYCMVMFGGVIHKGYSNTIPMMMGPKYLYNTHTRVPALETGYGALSQVLIPQGDKVFIDFLRGSSSGVPWGAWIGPLVLVGSALGVLVFSTMCAVSLLKKHWDEVEHFRYPLTVPVIEFTRLPEDRKLSSFWTNPIIWTGMLIPIIYYGCNGLNRYFPGVPVFPTLKFMFPYEAYKGGTTLFPLEKTHRLMLYRTYIQFTIDPFYYGVFYLLNLDLLFSLWFFRLVSYGGLLQVGAACYNAGFRPFDMTNWGFTRPLELLTPGAFLGIAIVNLWLARDNLKEVAKKALGKGKDVDDSNAPIPYKLAFWGAIFGPIVLVIWARSLLGLPVWVASLYFIIWVLVSIGFSRARAEGGWPSARGATMIFERNFSGTFVDQSPYAANLIPYFWGPTEIFPGAVASSMESYRLANESKLESRSMAKVLFVVFLFVMIVTAWSVLPIIYKYGALVSSSADWKGEQYRWGWMPYDSWYRQGTRTGYDSFGLNTIFFIGGAVGTLLLTALRAKFISFPFHVLGWAAQGTYVSQYGLSPAFIIWLVKLLINRWAGYKGIKKCEPFFIGIIMGSIMMQAVWAMIGVVIGR